MLALFRKVKQILRLYKAFLNGNFGLFGTKLLFEMRDKILVYPACLSLALRYSRLTSFIDGVTCVLFCGFSMGAVPFLRTSAVPCMWLSRSIFVSILGRVPMGRVWMRFYATMFPLSKTAQNGRYREQNCW